MTAEAPRLGYLSFLRANRRFLGFGFALTLFSGLGQTYFISTMSAGITKTFDLRAWEWGLCYAIATTAAAGVLIWLGTRLDDTGLARWTAWLVVALGAACLVMAWTPHLSVLVLGLFAVRLAGQGLMGHTAGTSMARYFDTARGRALTISGLGFAVGFALFPRLGVLLGTVLSWREIWLVMAGVAFVVAFPLTQFLLVGHGARHADWLARVLPTDTSSGSTGQGANQRHFTRGEALRDWRLYALLPGALACPFLMTGMIFFHADLAQAKGWTFAFLSSAMVALGIALYATSLVLGPLVDRFGSRRLIVLTQVPLIAAMVVLATVDAPLGAWVYLSLAGMTMGSMGPVFGSIWPELYGTLHLGSIRAVTTAAMAFSTALAPVLFGGLLDLGVGMSTIAWGGVGYGLLATLLMVPAVRARPPGS